MSDKPKAIFENGSTRSEYALMYDLIPKEAYDAYAERMGLGFLVHQEENWKKGGPMYFRETKRHAMTHWLKYCNGETDDDHLTAAFTNLGMLIWWERTGKSAWEVSHLESPAPEPVIEFYDPVKALILEKFSKGGIDSLDGSDKQYMTLLQNMAGV